MTRDLFTVQGEIIRHKRAWGRRPKDLPARAKLELLKAEAKRIRAAVGRKTKA